MDTPMAITLVDQLTQQTRLMSETLKCQLETLNAMQQVSELLREQRDQSMDVERMAEVVRVSVKASQRVMEELEQAKQAAMPRKGVSGVQS